ncbi:MAG: antibiotic biosynthesis monooxygenase [Thermoleophilia bacterium]|nr:antibiotic biosynthesis monooxygenase [Thermoleophilia bacterium]
MKTCTSCGMPMLAEEDFSGSDPSSDLCVNCGQGASTRGRLVSFAILESKLGKADDLLEVMRENLRQTRSLDGVTDAFISQSPENPNIFFTYSRWRDRAAYDAVQAVAAADKNPAITEDIAEFLVGEPLFGIYDVMD